MEPLGDTTFGDSKDSSDAHRDAVHMISTNDSKSEWGMNHISDDLDPESSVGSSIATTTEYSATLSESDEKSSKASIELSSAKAEITEKLHKMPNEQPIPANISSNGLKSGSIGTRGRVKVVRRDSLPVCTTAQESAPSSSSRIISSSLSSSGPSSSSLKHNDSIAVSGWDCSTSSERIFNITPRHFVATSAVLALRVTKDESFVTEGNMIVTDMIDGQSKRHVRKKHDRPVIPANNISKRIAISNGDNSVSRRVKGTKILHGVHPMCAEMTVTAATSSSGRNLRLRHQAHGNVASGSIATTVVTLSERKERSTVKIAPLNLLCPSARSSRRSRKYPEAEETTLITRSKRDAVILKEEPASVSNIVAAAFVADLDEGTDGVRKRKRGRPKKLGTHMPDPFCIGGGSTN